MLRLSIIISLMVISFISIFCCREKSLLKTSVGIDGDSFYARDDITIRNLTNNIDQTDPRLKLAKRLTSVVQSMPLRLETDCFGSISFALELFLLNGSR